MILTIVMIMEGISVIIPTVTMETVQDHAGHRSAESGISVRALTVGPAIDPPRLSCA